MANYCVKSILGVSQDKKPKMIPLIQTTAKTTKTTDLRLQTQFIPSQFLN